MKRSRRGEWRRKPAVSACAVSICLATLSSCSFLHRDVPTQQPAPQESVPQAPPQEPAPQKPAPRKPPAPKPALPKPVPAEAAPEVRVVDAAVVEQETQRLVAMLGGSADESIVASEEGYYLDVLQGRLQQGLGKRAAIRRDGPAISLEIPGGMTTDTSGPRLDSATQDILGRFGKVLVEYHATVVAVRVFDAGVATTVPTPSALEVVRCLVQAGAASTHLLLVAPGAPRADQPQSASNTDIRIHLRIQPIPRT
jgi:hypothetical protein